MDASRHVHTYQQKLGASGLSGLNICNLHTPGSWEYQVSFRTNPTLLIFDSRFVCKVLCLCIICSLV